MGKLKESFSKFTIDFFSKVIYDLLKLVFGTIIFIYSSKPIPFVNEVLEREYYLSILDIIIHSCLLILITSCLLYLFFRKKYKKIQFNNQIDELTGVKISKLWN